MDDLDSDEDDDVVVTSRDESKDTPALCTATATSCTSTHVEPSTSYNNFENRHCMETRAEEIVRENELEGETKDQTKDFQEKDSDSLLGKINQEGGLREDRISEKDQVTDTQPAEKVSEVKASHVGGSSGFQVRGMIEYFLGLENFGKYFFGQLDLSTDFWGYSKQSEDS